MKVQCSGQGCTVMIDCAKRDVLSGAAKGSLCPECKRKGKVRPAPEVEKERPSRFGR